MNKIITIEKVGFGHPDKIADTISNLTVNFLTKNKSTRVGIETIIGHKKIYISGEIKNTKKYDLEKLKRLIKLNLNPFKEGYEKWPIEFNLVEQSEEINKQVDIAYREIGAGDQGIMVGVGSNETFDFDPIENSIMNFIIKYFTYHLKYNMLKQQIFKQDFKIQLTLDLDSLIAPRFHLSMQANLDKIKDFADERSFLKTHILKAVQNWNNSQEINRKISLHQSDITIILFDQGGSNADVGITGRKLVCDAYGPRFPIGGGATAGKDLSKVDKSGKLYADKIAKGISKLYDFKVDGKVEIVVQISYVIGEIYPVHITVFKNGKISDDARIKDYINKIQFTTLHKIMKTFSIKGAF